MDDSSRKAVVNRSVPQATVIPVLAYEDVGQAVEWLCEVFGFRLRLRIGDHRAQLLFGDGAMIVNKRQEGESPRSIVMRHSLLVQVDDVDSHYAHALERGARILDAPTDYFYGERQYNVEDLGGHQWTFSQSIADVDPESWGATVYNG